MISSTKEGVFIRPLTIQDALVSYRWRNDPEVWKFTGSRPDRYITQEIEIEWAKKVLQDKSSHRFAICVQEEQAVHYVGNIQLTDITAQEGQYHIFIGDRVSEL